MPAKPPALPKEQTFDAITQTAALVVCRVLGIRVLWNQAGPQIPENIRELAAEALATHRVRRAYWRGTRRPGFGSGEGSRT